MIAIADRKPLPVSPRLQKLHRGLPPRPMPPSSYCTPARQPPVWSLPGKLGAGAALEAARVAVDEARVQFLQTLVVDPEPLGRVVAHVVLDHVGALDQRQQHLHRARILEIERDAPLAAVRHVGDVVRVPVGVVEGVDLDDVGAEVGQDLRAVRARDREPQIEDRDACERRGEPLAGLRAACHRPAGDGRRSRVHARRLGTDLIGVFAGARRRAADRAGVRMQPVRGADLANRSELRVVDFDDATVREKERIDRAPLPVDARPGSSCRR